jgi:hypothetical protein
VEGTGSAAAVRLAELVAAVSLATDLGPGQPHLHVGDCFSAGQRCRQKEAGAGRAAQARSA